MPRLIHLSVPAEKTEVDLKIKGVLYDRPPPAGAFLLGPPQGMEIVDLK